MNDSSRTIVRAGLLALTLLPGALGTGVAQELPDIVMRDVEPLVVDGTSARYDVHWRAAREGVNLAAAEPDKETRKAVLRQALHEAREATDLVPRGIDAHYWSAVASGLLAEDEGGRTKIRLAEQAWDESAWILGVDSLHAGAHHLQGRLHAAVMRLNPVTRFLARKLLGADVLGRASWAQAEYHLAKAVELAPDDAVNHLELGMAYKDMGRPRDARAAFLQAAASSPRRPADRKHIRQAEAMLASLPG